MPAIETRLSFTSIRSVRTSMPEAPGRRKTHGALAWLLVQLLCAIGFFALAASPADAKDLAVIKPAVDCGALGNMAVKVGDDYARITSAKVVSEDTPSPYCDVKGYVAPQIAFELKLPTASWTQRLLYIGCGGFCGLVHNDHKSLSDIHPSGTDGCPSLESGQFAVVASDLGHTSFGSESALWTASDATWAANNPQGRIDYAYRSVHLTTAVSKVIMEKYYGSRPAYAYYSGCSDGGREGAMAAQRYPDDFDGVIAGSAGLDLITQNSLFDAWRVQHLKRRDGSKILTDQEIQTLHDAVIQQCGAHGGQFDGLIEDPRTCHFDPQTVACDAKAVVGCLSPEKVLDVRELYRGPHDAEGHALYFPYPYGSELAWNVQIDGAELYVINLITYLTADRPVDNVDPWSIPQTLEQKALYNHFGDTLNSLNPNLTPFKAKGGKLLMWHPWADESVPPMSTVAYYQAVRATLGAQATDDFMRVYMLPGVYHCGEDSSPGPNKIDLLDPLMAWVEDGVAPGAITVSKKKDGQVLRTATIVPLRLDK